MGYGAAARSLIHTKLNRPRVAAQLVDRPRLDALLDAGRTLTIVTAPAGYGKSTLISDWVRALRHARMRGFRLTQATTIRLCS